MISRYAIKKLRKLREQRAGLPSADEAAPMQLSVQTPEAIARRRHLESQPGPGDTPRRAGTLLAPVAENTVIEARGLVKRYGSLIAVDDLSFSVSAGEIFGLLGPNGAGKTTTLEMLEGLRTPDVGDATVLGHSVVRYARRIKEHIGVQLQATALPDKTTVAEAVDLFGAFYTRRRPTGELLTQFGLTEKAEAMTESLSGGQMQRLSIALALVNDPDLVFLDEPTTGLDPQARLNLWDVIEGIRAQGKTVILTTHYMEEAERLCDRLAVIDRGHIIALDTPPGLIAAHAPGVSIEFETNSPDPDVMQAIPGVDDAEMNGDRVILHTTAPERVLARIFDPAGPVPSIRDLRVHQGTLEDVFITLTGRRLRP